MTTLQHKLKNKYRNLFGVSDIKISDDNNNYIDTMVNNVTAVSILGDFIVNGNLSTNSNIEINDNFTTNNLNCNQLNVTNNAVFNNNVCDNLRVTTTSVVFNDIDVIDKLITNNFTNMDKLNCNNINCSNIICNNIKKINNIMNINSDYINIGTTSSTVNILGTLNYINSSETKINDKIILINNNNNIITDYIGIEILSNNTSNGFIKSNYDINRFSIKAPLMTKEYIAEFDINENLNVSNNSLIYKNVSINSLLNISKNLEINQNLNINSLNVSNNSLCNNITTTNLSVINNSKINNDFTTNYFTCNGSLEIHDLNSLADITSNNCLIFNNTTVGSNIKLLNLNIKNSFTSSSNIDVINSNLCKENYDNNTHLNISGNTFINNYCNVNNLRTNQDCVLNEKLVIKDKFNIAKDTTINNNVTISKLNNKNIIIIPLKHYDDNTDAVLNNVPKWCLYRTGGIVKIRLDNIAPVLSLQGDNTITILSGNNYIEPGASAIDNDEGETSVFITSIQEKNTLVEYVSVNILISATNQEINLGSPLPVGNYKIKYFTTDIIGNESNATRNLNVNS